MNDPGRKISEEMLSGYIDGELTQQERQQVEIYCESNEEARNTLDELRRLRREIGQSDLDVYGPDEWRENMKDSTVNVTRGLGWLLLIGGLLVLGAVVLIEILFDSGGMTVEKLIIALVYGGLLALFISVLRQRLIERKSDKYKDVEI